MVVVVLVSECWSVGPPLAVAALELLLAVAALELPGSRERSGGGGDL